MLTPRSNLTRRIVAALDAVPSRIPVLLGGCGSGRSTLLQQLRDRIARGGCQPIDVERTATTPERFFRAVITPTPFSGANTPEPGARGALDAVLAFFDRARSGAGGPATFLLDEFLELRTFESFPGLRHVLDEVLDTLSASANRFILTSRYAVRSLRLLRNRSPRFEIIHVPPLTTEDTLDIVGSMTSPGDTRETEYIARTVHALADGRPAYVRALADELTAMRRQGGGDPVSALAALLAPHAALSQFCQYCYELRLHRARGYGALKAILEILAEQEELTLTEISQRLLRTPGSTKDYLSWLEDVDLVVARQKRYSFVDPLLRVWVRLHCAAVSPSDDDLAREVHRYAMPRLPQPEPALALAVAGGLPPDDERKEWGIIEID